MTNRCFGAAWLRSRVLCHGVAAVTLVTGVLSLASPPSVEAQSFLAPVLHRAG